MVTKPVKSEDSGQFERISSPKFGKIESENLSYCYTSTNYGYTKEKV